jgi:tRNA-Thr(GGU) m(6)t(6)A37 methyltransferase TsaA
MMQNELKFIGQISSPLKKLEDCPRQESEQAPGADLIVAEPYLRAMQELEAGMEVIVLTWLHQANRDMLVTKPRNNPNAPDTGIFATRSPDRPNPIGMHIVRIKSVKDNILKLDALEVLDGTPVIDIKPVF